MGCGAAVSRAHRGTGLAAQRARILTYARAHIGRQRPLGFRVVRRRLVADLPLQGSIGLIVRLVS